MQLPTYAKTAGRFLRRSLTYRFARTTADHCGYWEVPGLLPIDDDAEAFPLQVVSQQSQVSLYTVGTKLLQQACMPHSVKGSHDVELGQGCPDCCLRSPANPWRGTSVGLL